MWEESHVGGILCGRNPVGGIPCGRNPVWEESLGRNPVWEESCVGGIPCGRNPVWEESHVGGIPCGRNPVGGIPLGGIPWEESRGEEYHDHPLIHIDICLLTMSTFAAMHGNPS